MWAPLSVTYTFGCYKVIIPFSAIGSVYYNRQQPTLGVAFTVVVVVVVVACCLVPCAGRVYC